ncbi:MAG: sodium:solute symporter family transporter [Limisphaerales bacterium]
MKFNATDWFVVVIYLVGIIGLGVWLGRGQKSTRDYFLGGRDIPWWGVGFSIVATETSALTFIGVPAMAFGGDFGFIQVIIGYVIARMILAIVMVPHYFKGDVYSPYQLFQEAFGNGAKRTVAVFFLIAGTLAAGVRVYATCIPLEILLRDVLPAFLSPIMTAIFLFVILSLVYTYYGGIRSVVWTDAVQFVLLFGGGVYAVVFLATFEGAGWQHLQAQGGNKLNWFDASLSWSAPFNIWMGVIGATFLVMSSHGVDQLNVQRVLSCKSVSDGRKALILSALLILPMMLLFLFVGALLWSFAEVHGLQLPLNEKGQPETRYAFPVFILTEMPTGMRGLLIVGVCAAAMSSVSSALSALSSVSTMDLLKDFKRERSEAWFLRISKLSTLAWAAILIAVGYCCIGQDKLIDIAFALSGITSGGMLGGLFLVIWWKRGAGVPVIYGMFASLGAMMWIKWRTDVYWPWYTMIGCAVCIAVAIVIRRLAGGSQAQVAEGE